MSYALQKQRRINLKNKLKNLEPIYGGWLSFTDPGIAETFCKAGFDFIAIDMEHTTFSLEQAKSIITSCHSENVCCLPRPVSHNNDYIKPLLEAGADGMFIQMVETEEEVKKLINQIKYTPIGHRSYGVNRAHGYGLNFEEYINDWNETSSIILQIESIDAVNNIDKLLNFEEVDGVMIGPYDISGSLGVPGQTNHPKVREASQKVIESARKFKKSCCTQISDVSNEKIQDAFSQGFTFIILGSDLFVLANWSKQINKVITKIK